MKHDRSTAVRRGHIELICIYDLLLVALTHLSTPGLQPGATCNTAHLTQLKHAASSGPPASVASR